MRPMLILVLVCLSACEKKPLPCAELKPKYDAIMNCVQDEGCKVSGEDAKQIHDYIGRCIPRQRHEP